LNWWMWSNRQTELWMTGRSVRWKELNIECQTSVSLAEVPIRESPPLLIGIPKRKQGVAPWLNQKIGARNRELVARRPFFQEIWLIRNRCIGINELQSCRSIQRFPPTENQLSWLNFYSN
jgi:hypothetical protein